MRTLPSASIMTPELISRIFQTPSTLTTSIDPKRMSIAFAASPGYPNAGFPNFPLLQQHRLRAGIEIVAPVQRRVVGPAAGSHSRSTLSGLSITPGQNSGVFFGRYPLQDASSRTECLPSPVTDRPLLAVNNDRQVIEQHHPDLVLDFHVRRNRKTQARGKNLVHRATRVPARSITRKTDSPLVPSLGLTTIPSG